MRFSDKDAKGAQSPRRLPMNARVEVRALLDVALSRQRLRRSTASLPPGGLTHCGAGPSTKEDRFTRRVVLQSTLAGMDGACRDSDAGRVLGLGR